MESATRNSYLWPMWNLILGHQQFDTTRVTQGRSMVEKFQAQDLCLSMDLCLLIFTSHEPRLRYSLPAHSVVTLTAYEHLS